MRKIKEKKERALGVSLSLKPNRCSSPKCAVVRRPTRPGVHGKKRMRALSEFGQQLKEKQKIRFMYGVTEKQLANIFKKATTRSGSKGELIISLLERRLDNVVYRMNFAGSRSEAAQLVGHGHMTVNGRKVTTPSYRVKKGDVVGIRSESINHPNFKELNKALKQVNVPQWIVLDASKLEGKVEDQPREVDVPFDLGLVVDYYSK